MKRARGIFSFLGLFLWGIFSLVCGLIGCILVFIGFIFGRTSGLMGKPAAVFADKNASRKE